MDASVTWKGKLSFTGTAAGSGFSLPLDTTPDTGGDDEGFRPMELFALGLAGCSAMDVISILLKKRQEVSGFDVHVHAERSQEHPKVFTSAVIDFQVVGRGVEEAALVRAIELSALRYCPAQAMFGQIMPIRLVYHLFEEGLNGGERVLVKSGEYVPVKEPSSP